MTSDNILLHAAKFIYAKYPGLKDKYTFTQILSLCDRFEENLIIIKKGGDIQGVAGYLRLSDLSLSRLYYKVYNISDPSDLNKLMEDRGDNIHFCFVCSTGLNVLREGIKVVIKKESPGTISWFDPKFLSLRILNMEDRLCHQPL